jgi:sarcosine oxidase subunit gamma
MADTTHRHSPLAALADRLAAAGDAPARIRLTEVPFLTQLTLRVTPGTPAAAAAARALGAPLPLAPNTTSAGESVDVLWMGPDEWLVVAPPGTARHLEALERALGADHGSVIDVSAQRTVIEVAGADARNVLLKGCALDLHPRAFGVGRCAQTLLARAHVILHARTDEPAYRVFVRASFAGYLAEWLLDAAGEYRGADPADLSATGSAAVVAAPIAERYRLYPSLDQAL